MDSSLISAGCAVVAAGAAIISAIRNRSQDTDHHIDERIELNVGSRLTKMEGTLAVLAERIPSRDIQVQDSGRIDDTIRRLAKVEQDLAEAFNRIRSVETNCAGRNHVGAPS